jgi:hypothetical protein
MLMIFFIKEISCTSCHNKSNILTLHLLEHVSTTLIDLIFNYA